MEVEHELPVVDFTDEKTFSKQKKNKKRKRVGNRIPIGEKVAKLSRHQTPAGKKSTDTNENQDFEGNESIEDLSDDSRSSSDHEGEYDSQKSAPATFSSTIEALLSKASSVPSGTEAPILKDSTQNTTTKEQEKLLKEAKKAREDSRLLAIQRKLFKNKDHKIPDFTNAELEAKLRKVATRGIVKLFNAIKAHKKSQKEAVGIVRKTAEESTKEKFMEILKGSAKGSEANAPSEKGTGYESSNEDDKPLQTLKKQTQAKVGANSGASWEILRDDYLLGAKMKDWNKESDSEPEDTKYEDSSDEEPKSRKQRRQSRQVEMEEDSD